MYLASGMHTSRPRKASEVVDEYCRQFKFIPDIALAKSTINDKTFKKLVCTNGRHQIVSYIHKAMIGDSYLCVYLLRWC